MLDTTTEFGARVARRLQEERIIWLITVDPNQMPQPLPVWFLWDEQTFLIYSQPDTFKLRNIEQNPNVALHLDGDGQGGDIVVFTGQARLAPDAPPANQVAAFVARYEEGFKRIGTTPEGFAQAFSVALRVLPDKLRGH